MRTAITAPRRAGQKDGRASGCDVLIVEDDPDIREGLAEAMVDEGLTTVTAADGREALAILERTAPGVVITDLVMPGMNGWELAAALRAMPRLAGVPILFVTAIDNAHRVPPGPVFLKPLHLESLIRAVKTHLGRADA
jgi:CheY-like chemotaxis protein